jgi:hypothetical protein
VTQQFVTVIVISVLWLSWNSNFPVQHSKMIRNAESGVLHEIRGEKYGSGNNTISWI